METSDVLACLAESMECKADRLTVDQDLSAFKEWDSLALMSFMSACHKRFGKIISGNDLARCTKVSDLIALVRGDRQPSDGA